MGNSSFIYKGEKKLYQIFDLYLITLFLFSNADISPTVFFLTIFLTFLGSIFRIVSSGREMFITVKKTEYFYKTTRNPKEFGMTIQLLASLFYLERIELKLSVLVLYIMLLILAISKKENIFSQRFASFDFFKTKISGFLPNFNLPLKEFFERENKDISLFHLSKLPQSIFPMIVFFMIYLDAKGLVSEYLGIFLKL